MCILDWARRMPFHTARLRFKYKMIDHDTLARRPDFSHLHFSSRFVDRCTCTPLTFCPAPPADSWFEGGCTTLPLADTWHCRLEIYTPLIFPFPDKGTTGIVGIFVVLNCFFCHRPWILESEDLGYGPLLHFPPILLPRRALHIPVSSMYAIHLTFLLGNIYCPSSLSIPFQRTTGTCCGDAFRGFFTSCWLGSSQSPLPIQLFSRLTEAEQDSFLFS